MTMLHIAAPDTWKMVTWHHRIPSCACLPPGRQAVDTTGAGDLFAAGFLFGLLNGMDLRRCGEIGCMAGGAVVQTLVRASTRAVLAATV